MKLRITLAATIILFAIGAAFAHSKSIHEEQSPLLLRTRLAGLDSHELYVWRLDFPAGTAVSLHTHPGHEILLVLEGQVSIEVANEKKELKAGEIILIPADTRMTISNATNGMESRLLQILLAKQGSPLKEKIPG